MSTGDPRGPAPAPEYVPFKTEAEYQAAVDRLLAQEGRELRIFDPDLAGLRLARRERVEALERFLRARRTRRLYVAAHDLEPLVRQCARMMNLLARYSHAIEVRRTFEEIRSIQDSFLVMDSAHYVRRPVARFYRGALGLHDEAEALAMRARFAEIWVASGPGVSGTTTGL
jgi:transposase InsO family protein